MDLIPEGNRGLQASAVAILLDGQDYNSFKSCSVPTVSVKKLRLHSYCVDAADLPLHLDNNLESIQNRGTVGSWSSYSTC